MLFALGVIAGFINVMAGGGSTLTLPALIFLGLTPGEANGTNRIAILIQNISAVASFKKEKYSQFAVSWKLALFTLPGAIIGALAAVKISDEIFQKILGIVLIGVAVSIILPKGSITVEEKRTAKNIPAKVFVAMFFVGFYGGFVQAGVGFLLMFVLHFLMRADLVRVNMHKVFIVLIYTVPAVLIFAIGGKIDFVWGLVLAAGNAVGAWQSAKVSARKGQKAIKIILAVVIIIMSIKLLNIF